MAHSPSPASAAFATASAAAAAPLHHHVRRRSPSPPSLPQQQQQQQQQQQPLSKRDKRRNMIEQRLKDIATSFSRDRDIHTRVQLNALSRDMQFISKADLYSNQLLDDGPDDLTILLSATNGPGAAEAEAKVPLSTTAARFVNAANNEMEKRDAQITEVDLRYRAEVDALNIEYDFAIQVAEAEHQALKELARQRVVSSVHMRRRAIQKEKDQLDTADSTYLMNTHALTALAAPGSPSSGLGGGASRKTRYSRLRPDPADDAGADAPSGSGSGNNHGGANHSGGGGPNGGHSTHGNGGNNGSTTGGGAGGKRKRKAAHGDADESPGPAARMAPLFGGLWEGRGRPGDVDIGASFAAGNMPSASSPERFFTARELKTANGGAHATVAQTWTDRRLRHHLAGRGGGSRTRHSPGGGGGAAGESSDSDGNNDGALAAAAAAAAAATAAVVTAGGGAGAMEMYASALAAPAMDRSGSSHATRSTRLLAAQQQAQAPAELLAPPTVTPEGLEELDDPRRIFGLAALEAAAVRSKVSGAKDVEAPMVRELPAHKIAEDLAIIQSLMDVP